MEYNKEYNKKKKKLILDLESAFKNSQNLLEQIGFSIMSIYFENGRNEDDFIIIELFNREQSKIKIIFWINFWLEFEFNNNDSIIIYKLFENNDNIFEKRIRYSELNGQNLDEKIRFLIGQISNL
ncbi:Uncharacterised protein [Candidatus Ornithobacterium hominis]|uniref:hypothetical protein n=1 Tax=Candidatus Ornithobacterium hominis TaxID=2497989 RepID=UPI000E5A68A0|nr:hypothetical protein [Candidatus Ornithobacterium hominis]SZD73238.1 Uncharacterised protein [Candidatus Ornithobacterium hominis]